MRKIALTSTSQDLFHVLTISKDWHNLWSQPRQPSGHLSLHGQALKCINISNIIFGKMEFFNNFTYHQSMLYFLCYNHSSILYQRFHTSKYNRTDQIRIYSHFFSKFWISENQNCIYYCEYTSLTDIEQKAKESKLAKFCLNHIILGRIFVRIEHFFKRCAWRSFNSNELRRVWILTPGNPYLIL